MERFFILFEFFHFLKPNKINTLENILKIIVNKMLITIAELKLIHIFAYIKQQKNGL